MFPFSPATHCPLPLCPPRGVFENLVAALLGTDPRLRHGRTVSRRSVLSAHAGGREAKPPPKRLARESLTRVADAAIRQEEHVFLCWVSIANRVKVYTLTHAN